MFRRSWSIWLAYGLILALLLPGFGWLTLRVLDLDAQERLSRARAELEERISLGLWRMETIAMPIVAAEAARPAVVYQPYQALPGRPAERIASPLLRPPSEFVLLNFEVSANGRLSSPQCPPPADFAWACVNGTSPEILSFTCPRAEQLQEEIDVAWLLSELPVPEAIETSPQASAPVEPLAQGKGAYIENTITAPPVEPGLPRSPAADFASRASKLQSFAEQSAVQQRQVLEPVAPPLEPVREGTSRPLWVNGKLLLARRVQTGAAESIQGCWLDWERLRRELLVELDDLLPEAELRPVPANQRTAPGRTLASLPVELVPPPLHVASIAGTPTQLALAIAWGGLCAACVALALLLRGVSALSERRAAFVSAVTHELRTPLTTFQLYTEMLAGGMVEGERRSEYIDTLHREAGRLGHLVDNVLAYARLERQPARQARETLPIGALLDRIQSRLAARAELGAMSLTSDASPEAAAALVHVDPTIVEQVLLNLVDNACKYAASAGSAELKLSASVADRSVRLSLQDHGPGLSPDARRRLFQPFSKSDLDAARSAPGIGLGLALSRELARSQGGDLRLDSTGPQGTTFVLHLPRTPE